MIAGLTSTIEYQSKVLTEVAILTMLQQRLERFVILETTDKSSAWLHDVVTIFIYTMIRKQTDSVAIGPEFAVFSDFTYYKILYWLQENIASSKVINLKGLSSDQLSMP